MTMADIFNNTGCNFTVEKNCTNSTVTQGSKATTSSQIFETSVVIKMLVCYVIALTFALLGNLFGIYVVIKRSTKKRNTVHWMIANMAAADLIVALTSMPYYIRYLFMESSWYGGIVGEISCKLIHYLFHISISASILTISIISIDRFVVIVLPLKFRLLNKPKILACIIWVCSFGIMSVIAMVYTVVERGGVYYCGVWWKNNWDDTVRIMQIFYVLVFVILYALPLTLISLMYALLCIKLCVRKIPGNYSDNNQRAVEQSRRKVIKMLVAIVAVFAVTWFPAHVMHYYLYFNLEAFLRIPDFWMLFSFWLCQANSAINPILYVIMNDSFREEIYSILRKLKTYVMCKKLSRNESSSSLRSRNSSLLGMDVFTNITSFGRSKKYSMSQSPKESQNEGITNPASLTKKIETVAETPKQNETNL